MAYRTRAPRRRRQTRRSYGTRRRRQTMRVAPRRRIARMPRQKAKPCVCPGELTPTAKFALAQIDPFDTRCLGGKIPDSNSIPSIANCDTDQVALPTVASQNNRAMAFWPTYTDAVLLSGFPTADPNLVTWNTGTVANQTSAVWATRRNQPQVLANIEGIRPVAHAIRISSSLASTTATGFIHVGLATESRASAVSTEWELPTTVALMTGLAHYKRFTISSLTQSPITIINKWIDDTAFRYSVPQGQHRNLASSFNQNTFEFGGSWGQLVVFIEGAPANQTAAVSVEHILHTEMIPKKDSFILGTTAAPNSPGTLGAVGAMVSEIDFAHTEDEQESYASKAVESLKRGAAAQGAQIMETVSGPVAERVGSAAVNWAFNAAMGFAASHLASRGIPGINANPSRLALSN